MNAPARAVDASAFRFKGSVATLSRDTETGRRKFEAVFYSGELIANHWHWGNLVFDIATTKAKDTTGVLLEHDPNKITGSGTCSFGDSMKIEGLLSAKTDAAKFVADQSDEGFPWQMSHFIEPGEIDQVKPGQKVTVNGREFTGPLTIFRHNFIRHVTFCADGADANTSATVFDSGSALQVPPVAGPSAGSLLASMKVRFANGLPAHAEGQTRIDLMRATLMAQVESRVPAGDPASTLFSAMRARAIEMERLRVAQMSDSEVHERVMGVRPTGPAESGKPGSLLAHAQAKFSA